MKINIYNSLNNNTYLSFLTELFKYFNKTGQVDALGESPYSFKSHYIQGVTGLDNLLEQVNNFTEDKKQFVQFGTDKITLKLYEDVELSLGYLAMLYKKMTWSRINGKQMIPDNLLRFDMNIIISEVRNFNTVLTSMTALDSVDGRKVNILSDVLDNVSRYVYRLYDCQFVFRKVTHKDNVDNTQIEYTSEYELDIIYKFSTMDMEKLNHIYDGRKGTINTISTVSNNTDTNGRESSDRYSSFLPGGDQASAIQEYNGTVITDGVLGSTRLREYENFVDESSKLNPTQQGESEDQKFNTINKIKENAANSLDKLKQGATKLAKDKINDTVNGLINDTLGKLRDTVGLRAISSPQNVYDPAGLIGLVKGTAGDFVNQSISDLLGKAKGR